MSAAVLQVIRTTRELLADPRRWVKGMWRGVRDGSVVRAAQYSERPNCWCLSGALTTAVNMNEQAGSPDAWTRVRAEAEREILQTIQERHAGIWGALYHFNDRAETSHRDVLEVLRGTEIRLENS